MDLKEIQSELESLRPEEDDAGSSLRIITAKVGQMATGDMMMEDSSHSTEEVEHARRDLFAGLITAAVEYASEHEIDVEQAIEERLDRMRDQAEMRDALSSGDASKVADAFSEDSEDSDSEGSGRAFY